MEQSSVEFLQEEARQAYERTSGVEAFQCLQAVMLAEIALQLAKQNETLADIGKDMSAVNLSDL